MGESEGRRWNSEVSNRRCKRKVDEMHKDYPSKRHNSAQSITTRITKKVSFISFNFFFISNIFLNLEIDG